MEDKLKAVILVAGAGSRLYPITLNKPKCMVKVGGRPILDYQIRAYSAVRIEEIIIVGGYKIDQIRDYCDKIKDINIRIIENKYYKTTNNMYSLYLAKDEIMGNDFLLSNGDIIFDPDIIIELVHSSIKNAVVCDKNSNIEKHMKISIDNSGYVNNIDMRIPSSISTSSVSIFKFSKEFSVLFFEKISIIINKENNVKEWFERALQKVLKDRKLKIHPFDVSKKRWIEIDDNEDLIIAENIFAK